MTYPKHVVHQRPPPRAQLDQLNALALAALRNPLGHEPDPHELPEDLGDLGRRDKVPLQAELVASVLYRPGVVATEVGSEAHSHVASQWHGASDLWMVSDKSV